MKVKHYYDIYKEHLPQHPKCIIEIGVNNGDGLRWFHNQYPNSKLVGIDRHIKSRSDYPPSDLLEMDQCNIDTTVLPNEFDVVIDDGGHRPYQQSSSFKSLWPMLSKDGVYVIEDFHMGQRLRWRLWTWLFGSIDSRIRSLIRSMNRWNGFEPASCRSPKCVIYFPMMVIIKKGSTVCEIEQ